MAKEVWHYLLYGLVAKTVCTGSRDCQQLSCLRGTRGSAKLVSLWWKGAELCLMGSYFQMAVYGAFTPGYLQQTAGCNNPYFLLCLELYCSKSVSVKYSFRSGIQRLGTDVKDFNIHHYNSSWCVFGPLMLGIAMLTHTGTHTQTPPYIHIFPAQSWHLKTCPSHYMNHTDVLMRPEQKPWLTAALWSFEQHLSCDTPSEDILTLNVGVRTFLFSKFIRMNTSTASSICQTPKINSN